MAPHLMPALPVLARSPSGPVSTVLARIRGSARDEYPGGNPGPLILQMVML